MRAYDVEEEDQTDRVKKMRLKEGIEGKEKEGRKGKENRSVKEISSSPRITDHSVLILRPNCSIHPWHRRQTSRRIGDRPTEVSWIHVRYHAARTQTSRQAQSYEAGGRDDTSYQAAYQGLGIDQGFNGQSL